MSTPLDEELLEDTPGHIGQSKMTALMLVGQAVLTHTPVMENGGLHIVDMHTGNVPAYLLFRCTKLRAVESR